MIFHESLAMFLNIWMHFPTNPRTSSLRFFAALNFDTSLQYFEGKLEDMWGANLTLCPPCDFIPSTQLITQTYKVSSSSPKTKVIHVISAVTETTIETPSNADLIDLCFDFLHQTSDCCIPYTYICSLNEREFS